MIKDNKNNELNDTDKNLNISDVSNKYDTDEWVLFLDEFRKTDSYRKSNGQLLFVKFFVWLSTNYEIPKRKSLY